MSDHHRLALRQLSKFYPEGGVQALDNIDFDASSGEIHALVGENGAGKSTLVRLASGFISPSAGGIWIDGKPTRFRYPSDALKAGVGLVPQHPTIIPGFKVWEDCALGAEKASFGILRRHKLIADLRVLSERWSFNLNPRDDAEALGVGERQKEALLALLYRDVTFFLLDEPTAVLTPDEKEKFFELLHDLRADGRGIVLISHKLDEVLAVADRISVIRHGKIVHSGPRQSFDEKVIMAKLFGIYHNKATTAANARAGADSDKTSGPTEELDSESSKGLLVKSLTVESPARPFLRGCSFHAARGRVTGIAGVRDSGTETLELALAGFLFAAAGSIAIDGEMITNQGGAAFRAAGGAYVPADRMKDALAPSLPLAFNLAIHAQGRQPSPLRDRLGWLKPSAYYLWAKKLMRNAGVQGDPKRPAGSYSGGSLQRMIVSRELAEDPAFLLMVDPGWGLDAAARIQLEDQLRSLAENNTAILLISTDLDELVSIADEILVLRDGRLVAKFPNPKEEEGERYLREKISEAMVANRDKERLVP